MRIKCQYCSGIGYCVPATWGASFNPDRSINESEIFKGTHAPHHETASRVSLVWSTATATASMVADTVYRLKEQTKEIVETLLRDGVALVALEDVSVTRHAFTVAKQALNKTVPSNLHIPNGSDSAHVTGYHATGGLSARYNQYRHGFVWSDGHSMKDNEDGASLPDAFHARTKQLEIVLHQIADHILDGVQEHYLQLPSQHWFQDHLGPFPLHSQWHLKRFVTPSNNHTTTKEWLPTHTDPSLISLVVHDQQNGCSGLQCRVNGVWHDVGNPTAAVVVVVGAVLQYLTANTISACRHRVVYHPTKAAHDRMAATLFVRPRPDALLQLPPTSARLGDGTLKKRLTFEQWNARTARNYEKARTSVKSESTCNKNPSTDTNT